MTDIEISKALALAIGYHRFDVRTSIYSGNVLALDKASDTYIWRVFDYRDWNVIGPIAEREDCFPYKTAKGDWDCLSAVANLNADTPQKAIALAVIGAKK